MKSNFKYGLKNGLIYYAIGVIATWLTYVILGGNYGHVPAPYYAVAFLFLIGGIGWTFYYFVLLSIGQRSKINSGTLAVHLISITSLILYVYIEIYSSPITGSKIDPADIITVNKDTINNTGSIVDGNGDTLYSQKGGKVVIDKTKLKRTR